MEQNEKHNETCALKADADGTVFALRNLLIARP
jgi:hypothetical protein